MIIDHRTYTIQHGKSKEYIKLFETKGMPVQLKHLGPPIGYFETAIGPLNQVVHLWAYASLAEMEQKRQARDADPAWTAYKKKSAGMLLTQENKILAPTSFSPLK
jgi:hypothetical protein